MSLRNALSLLISVFVLLQSTIVFAHTGDANVEPVSRYFQESWTTRQGLPHNTVNSLAQTPEGYIWITTWEGIARFNGAEFKIFGRDSSKGLLDAGMRSTFVDSHGRLLFGGSRGGLAAVTHGHWQPLSPVGSLINVIWADDDGTIWAGTEGDGLFRESIDGKITRWMVDDGLPSNSVYTLKRDQLGKLWIGTSNGLVQWQDGQFIRQPALPAAPVFDVLPIHKGLLLATEVGLLRYVDGKYQQFHKGLANIAVSKLMLDHQHSLWIGTIERGVFRYSDTLGLEHLATGHDLPRNRVLSLLEDKENSIWIGTNGGLLRLRDVPFSTVTEEQGLAGDYVRTVLADKDGHSIWAGTSNGLSRYDIGSSKTIENVLPKQSVLSLAQQDDGTLYIGTYTAGVYVYHDGKTRLLLDREHGLISNEVRAILPAKDGSVWIGTSQGVSVFKDGQVTSYTTEEGLQGNFIVAMTQVGDEIWIGTGTGISIWRGQQFENLTFKKQINSRADSAEYAFGFFVQPQKHLLWAATDRGLLRRNLVTGDMAIIGRAQGLPFDKYFQVAVDRNNDMWLTSNRGILRFKENFANAVLDGKLDKLPYILYGESDGMVSAQANGGSSPTIAASADGALWMATARGIVRVDPSRLYLFSYFTPNVVIEQISVDGKPQNIDDTITLAPEVQRMEIRYAGLSFIMPTRVHYRTRLLGFDQVWRDNGNQRQVEFTNLAPGNYQLEIQAQNPRGKWGDSTLLKVTKLPFWWQTSLALYLAILGSLLVVVLIVWWRTQTLRRSRAKLIHQVELKTEELQLQTRHLEQLNAEKSELLQKLRHQAVALEKQAMQDELTGLPNRRAFDELFAREFSRAKQMNQPMVLAFIDIDHFKSINDTYSHEAGDTALELLAEQLRQNCRELDVACRWGGEEFALLLPSTTLADGLDVSERLRYCIASMDCNDIAPQLSITISIGVACSDAVSDSTELLNQADKALYRAKQNGRNRVES